MKCCACPRNQSGRFCLCRVALRGNTHRWGVWLHRSTKSKQLRGDAFPTPRSIQITRLVLLPTRFWGVSHKWSLLERAIVSAEAYKVPGEFDHAPRSLRGAWNWEFKPVDSNPGTESGCPSLPDRAYVFFLWYRGYDISLTSLLLFPNCFFLGVIKVACERP